MVDEGVPASRVSVGGLLPREVGGREAADLGAWGEEEEESKPQPWRVEEHSKATSQCLTGG